MLNNANARNQHNENVAFIRIDSSAEIGGGHLYRCLTLAHNLSALSYDIVFICRKLRGHLSEEVKRFDYALEYLPADKSENINLLFDAKQTCTIIESYQHAYKNTILIVDHYILAGSWYHSVGSLVHTSVSINDIANRELPVDIIIDTGLSTTPRDYTPWVLPTTQLLLGPQYAMLTPSFGCYRTEAIKREKVAIEKILIFFGSTDPKQQVISTLDILKSSSLHKKLHWTVLLSEHAEHFMDVKKLLHRDFPNSDLTSKEVDMAAFLNQFQLVIGANGINAFERCCLGIPAITMNAAENQNENAETLSQCNAIIHINESLDSPREKIISTLKSIVSSPQQYQSLKENALKVCDAQGVERIIEKIQNANRRARLISASAEHMMVLFSWQHDSNTRKFSRNANPPTIAEHTQWFNRILKSSDSQLYFVEQNSVFMAMVRIDFVTADNHYDNEISIIVNPELRNKGVGQKALALIKNRYSHLSLAAYIQNEHANSIKLFTQSGYEKVADNWYINSP